MRVSFSINVTVKVRQREKKLSTRVIIKVNHHIVSAARGTEHRKTVSLVTSSSLSTI